MTLYTALKCVPEKTDVRSEKDMHEVLKEFELEINLRIFYINNRPSLKDLINQGRTGEIIIPISKMNSGYKEACTFSGFEIDTTEFAKLCEKYEQARINHCLNCSQYQIDSNSETQEKECYCKLDKEEDVPKRDCTTFNNAILEGKNPRSLAELIEELDV